MAKWLRKSEGFTLIELLVVIAIIGILSSVVIAALGGARVKARDARRLADIKQIQGALELYADENGNEYPDDIYSSTAGLAAPKPFISPVPRDPRSANYPYQNLSLGGTACSAALANNFCANYVLGARFEGPIPLDVDGSVVGSGADFVDCSDTVTSSTSGTYCVQP